jgi:Na+-driven multidrug efflux pump
MAGGVASALARALGAGRQSDANALVRHARVIAMIMATIFTSGGLVYELAKADTQVRLHSRAIRHFARAHLRLRSMEAGCNTPPHTCCFSRH